jgi:hypothetical protein
VTGAASTQVTRRIPKSAVTAAALVVVAVGIAFRWWLAVGPLGRPSSDESVVGLQAFELVHHGHINAFYWGQAYGGSLEAILVAPWVWLFGTTTFALKLTTVLLGLTSSWLTWRIARHLLAPVVAAWTGLASLIWPATLVWYGTKEGGFYPLTATLGLAVVLIAVNIDEHPQRWLWWLGAGIATGLGWWMSPNIAYYVLPMVAWLVVRGHWHHARHVLIAFGGFALGASVWIVANVHSGFDSLHSPPWAGSSTYLSRFGFFWRAGLPFALGLRRPWVSDWYDGRYVGHLLYLVALVSIAIAMRATVRNLAPDLFLIVAAPFVYATFVGNWHIYEGRYTYFVASMLPILLGRVLAMRAGPVIVAILVVVPGIAFVRDYTFNRTTITANPAPMARALERAGYRTAIAEYGIAYSLTYESGERVVAIPASNDRYPPFVARVRDSTPAYVFHAISPGSDRALRHNLDLRHIRYRIITAGDLYAVLPASRFVAPALAR